MSRLAILGFAGALLSVPACRSPEAGRIRGGGPGADIGNRGPVVEFHAGAHPYYKTPCLTKPVPCDGPLPVFSGTSAPD
jgi:hypothetical protein